MSEIFFIRHAQSVANAQGLMAGCRWDAELSAKGKEDAQEFARQHKDFLSSIDYVYSSTLLRAKQTADILFEGIDSVQKEALDGLEERDLGDLTKKPKPNNFHKESRDMDISNGEDFQVFQSRVFKAFEHIAKQGHNKPLVVGHGWAWEALNLYFGKNLDNTSNLEIARIEIDLL